MTRIAPAAILIASPIVFAILLLVDAPYGRHRRAGWGPTLPARWSWVIMESPSVFLFGALFLRRPLKAARGRASSRNVGELPRRVPEPGFTTAGRSK